MGKIGVFIYNGFQEMEFWYPVLRLREIGAEVVVIGVEGTEAATSVLGYPVVPNVAMAATSPGDYAALIVPGGNVGTLTENAAFGEFLRAAAASTAPKHVRIAAVSQAIAPVTSFVHQSLGRDAPPVLTAPTTDDVPQSMRTLLKELES